MVTAENEEEEKGDRGGLEGPSCVALLIGRGASSAADFSQEREGVLGSARGSGGGVDF